MNAFTQEMCTRCHNKGYYRLFYQSSNGEEKQANTFCTCENGQDLRQVMQDFRLSDIKAFANEVLPRLEKAHSELHVPDKAGNELRLLMDEIRQTIAKVEKSMN